MIWLIYHRYYIRQDLMILFYSRMFRMPRAYSPKLKQLSEIKFNTIRGWCNNHKLSQKQTVYESEEMQSVTIQSQS